MTPPQLGAHYGPTYLPIQMSDELAVRFGFLRLLHGSRQQQMALEIDSSATNRHLSSLGDRVTGAGFGPEQPPLRIVTPQFQPAHDQEPAVDVSP